MGQAVRRQLLKTTLLCIILTIELLIAPTARYNVIPQVQAENPPQGNFETNSPTVVAAYIRKEAIAYGVKPTDALWIVSHESQDGQRMRGDDGQSRGYWMISSIWHPEVSIACADDLQCSTAWSLKWILAGHISQWSTWRLRFKLYPQENPPL